MDSKSKTHMLTSEWRQYGQLSKIEGKALEQYIYVIIDFVVGVKCDVLFRYR